MSEVYKTPLGKVSVAPRGEFSLTTTYEPNDVIRYSGNGYIVKKKCTGVIPEDGEYYSLIAGFEDRRSGTTVQYISQTDYDNLTEQEQNLDILYIVDDL